MQIAGLRKNIYNLNLKYLVRPKNKRVIKTHLNHIKNFRNQFEKSPEQTEQQLENFLLSFSEEQNTSNVIQSMRS